ncbi:protein FAM161B-like [Tigriopus californicus]|uniref:protein FAM161B-like n=1 Tax=Tigriopus californicus TaxID=6832 RepID=UPI0027DA164C|nr:protein FAM161B-like [Tigriopus californicus]
MPSSSFPQFANGCVSTPLDKRTHLPKPLYERKLSDERTDQVSPEKRLHFDSDPQVRVYPSTTDSYPEGDDEEENEESIQLPWQPHQEFNNLPRPSSYLASESADIDGNNMGNDYEPGSYRECSCGDENLEFLERLHKLKQENLARLERLQNEDHDLIQEHMLCQEICHCCPNQYPGNWSYMCQEYEICDDPHYSCPVSPEGLIRFDRVETDSEDEEFDQNYNRMKVRKKRRARSASALGNSSKTTMIQPFQMTLREEQKRQERDEMLDLMREQGHFGDKSAQIQPIGGYKFQATPVPDHVYRPLFREMVAEHPQRFPRRTRGKMSSRMQRSRSNPELKGHSYPLKAKEFPAHIFTNYAYEKQREADRYRQLQRELRQKELYKKSKWPPRMKESIEMNKGIKSKLKKHKSQRASSVGRNNLAVSSKKVPDFDALYHKFQANLENQKGTRMSTVVEPFSFDARDQEFLQRRPKSAMAHFDPPKPPTRSKSLASLLYENSCRTRSTTANDLRTRHNLRKLSKFEKQDRREAQKALELELRQREMRRNNPAWAQLQEDLVDCNEIERKKLERLAMERDRIEEYQWELEKMFQRVNEGPTLFERQAKLSAKQNAEKRYQEVLKKEGLVDNDFQSKPKLHRRRKSRFRLSQKIYDDGLQIPSVHGLGRISQADSSSVVSECDSSSVTSEWPNVHPHYHY